MGIQGIRTDWVIHIYMKINKVKTKLQNVLVIINYHLTDSNETFEHNSIVFFTLTL